MHFYTDVTTTEPINSLAVGGQRETYYDQPDCIRRGYYLPSLRQRGILDNVVPKTISP